MKGRSAGQQIKLSCSFFCSFFRDLRVCCTVSRHSRYPNMEQLELFQAICHSLPGPLRQLGKHAWSRCLCASPPTPRASKHLQTHSTAFFVRRPGLLRTGTLYAGGHSEFWHCRHPTLPAFHMTSHPMPQFPHFAKHHHSEHNNQYKQQNMGHVLEVLPSARFSKSHCSPERPHKFQASYQRVAHLHSALILPSNRRTHQGAHQYITAGLLMYWMSRRGAGGELGS